MLLTADRPFVDLPALTDRCTDEEATRGTEFSLLTQGLAQGLFANGCAAGGSIGVGDGERDKSVRAGITWVDDFTTRLAIGFDVCEYVYPEKFGAVLV